MANNDELVKQETALTTVPEYMRPYAGAGLENIPASELEVPRIKLLQALSPEINEHNEARSGMFWHSILDQSFGRSVRIVPVYVDQSFILWRPRHMGGGILARAADGIHWVPDHGEFQVQPSKDSQKSVTWTVAKTVNASGLAEWGSSDPSDPNSQPAATKMYNVVVVLPDFPAECSPAVVTLQRSAIPVARKFLGKLKISQGPSYGQYFVMESVKDQNNRGQEFWNFKFTMAGFVPDPEEFKQYEETYKAFKQMGLRIKDIESLQDDEPAQPEATAF